MSLRTFHLFFIVLAFLTCAGLSGWAVWQWEAGGPWLAGLSAAAGLGLIPYLLWFRRTYRAGTA